MRSTKRTLALAGAGLAAILTLSACGDSADVGSQGGTSGHEAPSSTASDSSREADVMFAQMMIPHHEQAVEMADVALANASASSEVKGLATQIKAAQDPEIRTMKGWLSGWGAPVSAPMDHGVGGMMSDEDMAALASATGAEFDRQWLTMMIEHHQGAITMAQDVRTTTTDAGVKALAQAIVEAQQKEITTMQGLLG